MPDRRLDEEEIFHVARKIPDPEARAKYLDQICSGDQRLSERVEALLRVHEQEQAFLESESPNPPPTAAAVSPTERPGATIGRYRLMEQIGEGGMGIVYVAEQEKPLRRKVALKVIKPGMDSKAVTARFEAERQALAMMNHANIAKVFDAGTTDAGHPYFVMELVRGVPITEYCDQNKLTIRERLELFSQVCQAIQHAHQKGIIHRDIKPSNVLVTLHDDRPVPKVIDFGVAKALNARLTDRTIYTEHLQVIGTLLYMSPEQAQLSGLDIDTRSDIYSLGVLLYELLTGTTPFQKQDLDQAGFDEQRRIIREQEPPRASIRISSLGETATSIAEHRRTDANKLHQQIRGDLDWIVLKALEKDRTRRYESAASFSADIGRYLRDEAVVACPPSATYRFMKFARRNKGKLIAAALIALSLVTGTVVSTWLAVEVSLRNKQLADAVNNRERTNIQLTAALENWQQELYQRALVMAFSGDRERAEEVIQQAWEAAGGTPPRWESKIRAQLSLFNGEVGQALSILERSVDEDPLDFGAVALLAVSCLESGKHDRYLAIRKQLAGLTTPDLLQCVPAEDRLLVAQAQMFGDIKKGMETVESVLGGSPSALALAFHSQALMKRFYDDGNEEARELALKELDAAKLLMPKCAYVSVLELWANLPFMSEKDRSSTYSKKAEEAIAALEKYEKYPGGRHARACYFDFIGQVDDARREWTAVIGSSAGGYLQGYFAAFEYRNGNRDLALNLLHTSSVDSVLSEIHYGEALAMEKGSETRAREVYEDVSRRVDDLSIEPDDYVGVPETILLLLGDAEQASGRLAARQQSGRTLSWQNAMLEFMANPDMSPDHLLAASPRAYDRVVAHRLIAFRCLSRGEVDLAEDHLSKCVEAFYWQPDAYWANAFLSRLRTDTAWREWLRTRHEVPSS